MTTEFSVVKLSSGDLTYSIMSQGCEIAIEDLLDNACLTDRPLEVQVLTVLNLLDHSNLCQGFYIEDGATVIALVDHENGSFHDMHTIPMDNPGNKELRGFSSKCKILSYGKCCVSFQLLHDLDSQRKERKRKNTVIKPFCRKDYLTKDEVISELENERRKKN